MKRITLLKKISALVLAVLMLCLSLTACNNDDGGDGDTDTSDIETGADTSDIPDIPDTPNTDGPVVKGEVPDVPLGSDTVVVTSEEMLRLITSGEIAENGDYAVTDGEYLTFARAHNDKEYDLKGAIIRIGVREGEAGFILKSRTITLKNALIVVYGGTAVAVPSENTNATLTDIHVSGDAYAAFDLGGSASTVSGCTVKPADGGKISHGVLATGSNGMVSSCNFEGVEAGVTDGSKTGLYVYNCLFTDCTVGVSAETANTFVISNTISGGDVGIKAAAERAEISAVMCDVYNVIAAKNEITGAGKGILFENISNCVALMNASDDLWVTGCINAYVHGNRVSRELVLKKNDYVIADSNTRGSFQKAENTNVNGGDLTDLDARAAVGVNTELLPHINKEQFAGMAGRMSFRTHYGTLDTYAYVNAAIAGGEKDIIIPPGTHNNGAMIFSGLNNINLWGYGVYNDTIKSTSTAFSFISCKHVNMYGFFIGNSINPNLQGTVIKVSGKAGNETVQFVADPGYLADYTNSSNFPATNGGVGCIYEPDSAYPYSEVWYIHEQKTYSATTQINTLKLSSEGIKYGRVVSGNTANPLAVGSIDVGDRVAFRNYKGAGGVSMSGCSNMKLEDVTIFNSSGFALSDYDADVSAYLHRYAVAIGPAPVIDDIKSNEVATVNDYNRAVTWTDSYGRLRSAFSLNTTCDATHNTNSRTGMQAVSCLMEGMNDDGGNINAHYGSAVSFDAATKTLTYQRSVVKQNNTSYHCLPSSFKVGDSIWLYSKNGENVGIATVTEATKQTVTSTNETAERYTVKIDKNVTLTDPADEVVVENLSACGGGFLWDNVLVRNNNSYGVRIQSANGTIKNCTFSGLEKGGISMIPQIHDWPECGYARDIEILNNEFSELGILAAQWHAWDSGEYGSTYMPIRIACAGEMSGDPLNCLFANIRIDGNKFSSRYTYYDIAAHNVQNLTVTNNTFTGRRTMENTDTQGCILIMGGNGINVDGNTFTNAAGSNVYIKDNVAQNVTGSNVN